jgi:type I restriction enzyme S subunit
MNEWKETTLSEISIINPTENLVKGIKAKKVNMDVLIPFTKKIPSYSIEEYKGGMKFRNGDTLIARITPCLENGKTAYVDFLDDKEIGFGSTEFIVLRKKDGKSDSEFLYYFAMSPSFRDVAILSMTGSSGRQRVQLDVIKNHPFLFPPLPEQRAIASVLSSLDDKIDLLQRENKTLEAMAETLFRQWFIEEAKDEWEEVSLGDSSLATIIKSGINRFEGEKIYLETSDVDNTNLKEGTPITFENRPSRANMEPVVYSVWFAKKGGVRKLLMFDDYSQGLNKLVLSTGFTGLKTTEFSHYYIWCYVMSSEFQEIKDSFVSGSVQPDINNDGVKQIMIPNPDNETLLKFNSIVKELFFKISFNQQQIRTLEKLRDTLLPKLMSGEVRIQY